ncbi:hypothetical protein LX32DRAFT_178528 [Colletotrichum zoysiae]|uniref:Uncharacterized protein n=1 Tax=Colletotrichum zoysiae TaxID=1216348 RepID=A0AAD9H618_9PEZI|nr:hypothetical protein LX32DRAFT_178528 [Colletotrichum zoysiae]
MLTFGNVSSCISPAEEHSSWSAESIPLRGDTDSLCPGLGVGLEAACLAGHWKLNNLCITYVNHHQPTSQKQKTSTDEGPAGMSSKSLKRTPMWAGMSFRPSDVDVVSHDSISLLDF